MISFVQLVTSTLLWLVTGTTVHADKFPVSRLSHGESGPRQVNRFTDGTHGESGRILKKTKKSKAPAKMKKSKAPKVLSCSTCYKAADSDAFIGNLTNPSYYSSTSGLILNICAGQTIDISHVVHVWLTNPDKLPCKISKLTINCCGGLRDCSLQSSIEDYYGYDVIKHVINVNSYFETGIVALSVTLNGINLSTSSASLPVENFFDLPPVSNACTNTVSGFFKAVGMVKYSFHYQAEFYI
jgi:hypothetical protein